MATTTLFNNARVSAPLTSPTVTVPAGSAGASYDLSLTAPSPSGVGAIAVVVERSGDGGATWQVVVSDSVDSPGLVAKGPNAGQVPVFHLTGVVANALVGDLVRARVPSVTGTWHATMTLTA